jgi:hypothetical protein
VSLLRMCNIRTSQKPAMYSKNPIKRGSSHRTSRAWVWILFIARNIVFFVGTNQDDDFEEEQDLFGSPS